MHSLAEYPQTANMEIETSLEMFGIKLPKRNIKWHTVIAMC
jgi:hypothetical protein